MLIFTKFCPKKKNNYANVDLIVDIAVAQKVDGEIIC